MSRGRSALDLQASRCDERERQGENRKSPACNERPSATQAIRFVQAAEAPRIDAGSPHRKAITTAAPL